VYVPMTPEHDVSQLTGDGPVSWETNGRVQVIRLGSPPANAIGRPLLDGLSGALDAFDASSAKVLVVCSSTPGFFAAGADITQMENGDRAAFEAFGVAFREPLERLAAHSRPSIAVVEGLAFGGGLELAMAATFRIAGDNALFAMPEVKLGLIPGAGGTQRLPRLVGRGNALGLMLLGNEISGTEAARMGLVDRVTQQGAALEAAMSLAGELAGMPAAAMTAVMRCVDESADLGLSAGLEAEVVRINDLFDTADAREGIAAFLQGRVPRYT
jgi:enoyl-CoA hydratase/carnithine racemase